jgi:hypothetical protein
MRADVYLQLKERLISLGYAHEIDWAETVKPCTDPLSFWLEYSWVVVNSGMKNQVARKIWDRIFAAYKRGGLARDVFGHQAKATAIDFMYRDQVAQFEAYQEADDKIAHLKSLPWIGNITKWHLAKNLGFDCCKPDRHLMRIDTYYGTTPERLCAELSRQTCDRVATVDLVIWRAANLGWRPDRENEGLLDGNPDLFGGHPF